MHSNLNMTTLRGYVQLSTAKVPGKHIPLKYLNGTNIINATGGQVFAVDNPHYLGPLVIANKDRPVRIKFTNFLPTGAGGNLFLPVDTTVMGSGMFDINWDPTTKLPLTGPNLAGNFAQNRATLHLHGGNTPWISDGTQHQWITPAGERNSYPKGVSVAYVPDMWFSPTGATVNAAYPGATNNPGDGSQTFYYTNQQTSRLMFYHDHAYGITRLNVYAGEAAGYLETDPVEQGLIASGVLPDVGIPLVIQDKTFLPDVLTLAAQDPTWPIAVNASRSDFWFPHVYMPNQNPGEITGANAMGRWDYGPWFWPVFPTTNGPVPNPLCNPTCPPGENSMNPGIPNPSIVPEAFMDSSIVNGNAYPYLQLGQKPYRFRILNAGNDRSLNMQLYYASTAGPFIKITGGNGSGSSAIAAVASNGSVTGITITNGGAGYTSAPTVSIFDAPGHTPQGSGALATATVDLDNTSPMFGTVTSITVRAQGTGYSVPTICKGTSALPGLCTEVSMVPAVLGAANFPASWKVGSPGLPGDILDGRAGGVPDPASIGPSMIQIGTEGGFLPAPDVIENRPIGYEKNTKSITVGNVLEKAVFLGPAERADVIVDFAGVPNGSTLILYNDAPAPVPAFDARYDYYTNNLDWTLTGGAPSTLPGYGPNTRTVMQIQVLASLGTAPAYNLAALQTALPAAYGQSQDKPIVPQASYNTAFNANYPADAYARIQSTNMTFIPAGSTTNITMNLESKAIQELFDPTFGRMNAMLGVEVPFTNAIIQTTIPYTDIDPPTEIIKNSVAVTPMGSLDDGTQIWKITHNGVDTHAIHWHMFNVQVINRVGWDGAIKPPDPNELGWKDTVRMNPLEDVIIATRPIIPNIPFDLPNSIRPLDVTAPLGSTGQFGAATYFTSVDPANNKITVTNHMVNFGWEYVWHCHLLGHEENIMMRGIAIAVAPNAPSNLVATATNNSVALTWMDNSTNEINFVVQRAEDTGFTTGLANFTVAGSANGVFGGTMTFTDTTTVANTSYYYRVLASNVIGDTAVYAAPSIGFPVASVLSAPSAFTGVLHSTAPTIITQPSSQTVVEGQTSTFNVTAAGTLPLSYQWQKNGVDIPGATGASYTTPPATLSDNGSVFRVNVTNSMGSVMSNGAVLTVLPVTSINLIQNPGFESGKTSWTFYTNGVGTFNAGPPAYAGNNSARLAFSTVGTNMQLYQQGIKLEPNTLYQLSFAAYSNTGHDIRVRLFKQVTPYTPYGLDYTANLGTSWTVFTTQFTTTGFVSNVTDGRLQFWLVPFAKAGDTYYIDNVRLEKVSTAPVLPGIVAHPASQTVVTGQTATFSVVATGTSLSYQWQKNGTDIAGATGASYTTPPATLLDNGSVFRVNVTNPAGSVMSNGAVLTVLPVTSVNLIQNPGFESGTTSWVKSTNGVMTFSAATPGYSGSYAGKVAITSINTNLQIYQSITLAPNTRYRLSFAAYSNTGHDMLARLTLGVSPYTTIGTYQANLSNTWQTFTTEFVTTSATNVRLQFFFAGTGLAANGDTYYIDEVMLQKI
ncbi:Laccase [uncultured archaeon]|nr:Laccase [uncultured archaeon]